MARNSPFSLIMSRIRSSCESPTMCWAFCYRENLCGISESKELFYDLVIIKGTRLVSEQPPLFLPFIGTSLNKGLCVAVLEPSSSAWSHWKAPKTCSELSSSLGASCVSTISLPLISVQQLSLKQAGECSKGLLCHIQPL